MLNLRPSDSGRMTRDASAPTSAPHLWAIASGKGGVGKSVVSTNFSVSLAGRGHSVALLDLDLGCANLHTMLGVSSGKSGLSRLIEKETDTLTDALVPTGIEGLRLLTGDQAGPGMANMSYAHKHLILRQARRLDVEHVVLDLGAGTAFNVLDFFLGADTGIVVVVPEPTSIENTYEFLLAAFLRSLRSITRRGIVREAIDKVIATHRGRLPAPRDLLEAVVAVDAQAGVLLWERFEGFSANLIVNRVRNSLHHELGPQIVRDAHKHFGASLHYSGTIVSDDCVVSGVVARRPVIHQFPGSSFTRDLEAVTSSLLAPEQIVEPTPIRGNIASEAASVEPTEVSIDLTSPGASLRRRREALGLTLPECEMQTRIRCLSSIENEDFDTLPPEQYLRAFVAQYALLLGIDEAAALAAAFADRAGAASQGQPPMQSKDEPAHAPKPKPESDSRARPRPPHDKASHRRRRRSARERSVRRRPF